MAAPTRTNRGTASLAYTAQSTATIVSGSITPAASALMVVQFFEFTNDTTPSLVVTDTFTGTGAWSYVSIIDNDGGNFYVARFAYAKLGASPGTGTITCTRRAGTFTMAMAADFIEVNGAHATTPVRQSKTAVSAGTSATLTQTSTCLTDSLTFTGITVDDGAAPTTPSGYSARNSFALPATAVYGNSAEDLTSPAQAVTWTGLGSYKAALYVVEIAAAVGGTTTNQAITASSTATVSVVKRANKAVTTSATATPSFKRDVRKRIVVASTATPSIVRRMTKAITVSSTATVVVARTKVVMQAITAAATATVALVRRTNKAVAASSTASASLGRDVRKMVTVVATGSPNIAKRATKAITASATGTVVVTAGKIILQAITAAATGTVSVVRRVGKGVAATSTAAVSLRRQVSKKVSVSSTATPTMAKRSAKTITAASTATVTVRKRIAKTITVASTATARVIKRITKRIVTAAVGHVSIANNAPTPPVLVYLPRPVVEMAFGHTWRDTTMTWTNVSSWCYEARTITGRSSELDVFSAGTLSLTLDNDTRRFDPLNAAGPYYGQLLPNVPVRVRAHLGTDYLPVWYGYIDAFVHKPGARSGDVEVTATDATKIFAGIGLPQTVYDTVVEADSPRLYLLLGGATGDVMTDYSGNRYDGQYGEDRTSASSITPYLGPALKMTGTRVGAHVDRIAARVDTLPITFEAWVFSDDGVQITDRTLFRHPGYIHGGPYQGFALITGATGPTTYISYTGSDEINGAQAVYPTVNLYDGLPHHLVLQIDSGGVRTMYLDGVPQVGVISGVVNSATPRTEIYIGVNNDESNPEPSFVGSMSNVALYPALLSAATIQAHYLAGSAPWDGDTTGQRLNRILDLIGWPAAMRDIDDGEITFSPARLAGRKALDYLQTVAQTEYGSRFFMAADGRLTFHGRARFQTAAVETTSQYTFDDHDRTDPANVGILLDSLAFTLNDSFVFEGCTVTRDGGEAQSASSVTNPTKTFDIGGLLLRDDRQSRSLAERIVARYSTPQVRADGWAVMPQIREADWGDILALAIGHRVTLAMTPQAVGDEISIANHIQRIAHTIDVDNWTISYAGSPVDDTAYFTWGGYGPTTGWGAGVWR